jgi:hypothetical protein
MKAETNPVMDALRKEHPANQGVAAAIPPAQAGRLMSKYDEEWVAFVNECAKHPREVPDDFAACPRVWNLPHG